MKKEKAPVRRKTRKSGEKGTEIRSAVRSEFYQSVAEILRTARSNAYRAVNFVMVETYWNVGRQFYLTYPICDTVCHKSGDGRTPQLKQADPAAMSPIRGALSPELSWSHYRLLIRVEKPAARNWYMNEAAEQHWSVRALERQINSLYYERLLMSRDKAPVIDEMREKTAALAPAPQDFIKDPYVLEFLGLKDNPGFRESDLEQAIIGKLKAFMLELGKGFAFVARQHRISTETKDFFVDLVFYNYILKCFVLVDLKTGELTHQDIGQMDMYVRLFEDKIKGKDDNPTVGLILCTNKDQTMVKYSVLSESRQLFASKYRLYLPSEEELRAEIKRERETCNDRPLATLRRASTRLDAS